MAPMTRSRSQQPGDVPWALMAEYYAQRASAGLIISEATQISLQGKGYAATPGIYTPEQVAGWKEVTNRVHLLNGKMIAQLWHVGRVSSAKVNGLQPIAPSALFANDTFVYIFDSDDSTDAVFVPIDEPREMSESDISQVVQEFAVAASNAILAGFDGVEVHAANGYLIDQFLRKNSNIRSDKYGGSAHNRIRFLMEVVSAVAGVVGKERTGVRLSPYIKFKDMDDPEMPDTILLAAEKLNELGIAYIHLCEADWDDAPQIPISFRRALRTVFNNTLIVTGNKAPAEGEGLLMEGLADIIGFGRKFIANPDYPDRVKYDLAMNTIIDTHTLFGGRGSRGYTDYSFYSA